VDVTWAVVLCKVQRILNRQICKILIAERNHFLLGHKSCQLISACLVELTELNTRYLGSDISGDVPDIGFPEKIREGRVCIFAMLDMLELLESGVLDIIPANL
jgi:hypothetical protein